MRKIFLTAIVCIFILPSLNAQNAGKTWLLSRVQITETFADGTTTSKEISISDKENLVYLLGPKEISFLSTNQVNYKRMGEDEYETLIYSKADNMLKIELSECLLTLSIENKNSDSTMQLSESKIINKDHTIKIIYNYTKK